MKFNHQIGQWVFAGIVGLLVAIGAYRWASNPAPGIERAQEEAAVAAVRVQLPEALQLTGVEFVDPVASDRSVGKAYVYRAGDGWEVSGYYRRDEDDRWHPFLMTLDASNSMTHLKVQDDALLNLEGTNPALEVLPGATQTH